MFMHVVHLEDDGPLRQVLQAALCAVEPGIDLRQFVVSDDAVSYIEDNKDKIDLFILDIRVPGELDGMGVAQKIRDLKVTSPVVITSAFRSPGRDLLKKLNCEWFPKPWHILNTTQKILDIAKQRRRDPSRYRPPRKA
jgi:DNA-binding NtrC family response regulator